MVTRLSMKRKLDSYIRVLNMITRVSKKLNAGINIYSALLRRMVKFVFFAPRYLFSAVVYMIFFFI